MRWKCRKKYLRFCTMLFGVGFVFFFMPKIEIFAEDINQPIEVRGTTLVQDGNVTVSENATHAVKAEDANVTINGNVETYGINNSYGVHADNSKVTVNGTITTNGSDQDNLGINAVMGSNVIAGDIITKGYQSDGISAFDSTVKAGNVTTENDDAAAVRARTDSTIDVKNVKAVGVRYSVGLSSDDNSIITADNVTVTGCNGIGVQVNKKDAAAVVNGNVIVTGNSSNGLEFALGSNGKMRIGGNVRSEKGYGAVIYLTPTYFGDSYYGPTTLVIEGSVYGKEGPIAIVLAHVYEKIDEGYFVQKDTLDFNLNHYELPVILLNNEMKSHQLVTIVYEDEDADLIVIQNEKTEALKNAIINHIQYITGEGKSITIEIGGKIYTYQIGQKEKAIVIDDTSNIDENWKETMVEHADKQTVEQANGVQTSTSTDDFIWLGVAAISFMTAVTITRRNRICNRSLKKIKSEIYRLGINENV